jgi:hypothetical protein
LRGNMKREIVALKREAVLKGLGPFASGNRSTASKIRISRN